MDDGMATTHRRFHGGASQCHFDELIVRMMRDGMKVG